MKNWAENLLSELLFDHSQNVRDGNKRVPDVIILDFLLTSYLPLHFIFL